MSSFAPPPKLPFPWAIGLAVLRDAIRGRRRSFRADSISCLELLSSPPTILQPTNIPLSQPALLVMNHYTRPGFGAWWIALGISAQLPVEAHWMMTAGWNHAGLFNPLTRWLFPRLAQVYGFTVTPPMPPDPKETERRAKAVREVLQIAKNTPVPIAVAPEGQDHPGGILAKPPPGVGRFLIRLARYRERITPVGVFENGPALCFNFGASFRLDIPSGLTTVGRDSLASQQVMEAIAHLLPYSLRGDYA